MLSPGETAPDFEAEMANGRRLRLSSLRGRSVVLYFYPKAESPGCTRESREFARRYGEFTDRGAEVVGVSVDDVEGQRQFAERCSLPFPLVADPDREVSRSFGVLGRFGLARRVTFIVDPSGVVRHVIDTWLPKGHVVRAAEVLSGAPVT